jgi:hypothetical protein
MHDQCGRGPKTVKYIIHCFEHTGLDMMRSKGPYLGNHGFSFCVHDALYPMSAEQMLWPFNVG